jgi:hypothetical protein
MLLQPWVPAEVVVARGGSAGRARRGIGGAGGGGGGRPRYTCPIYAYKGFRGESPLYLDCVEVPSDLPIRIWQRQCTFLTCQRTY